MPISISPSDKKILSSVIAVIMLMEMLDATVLNTALPQIALSFHVSPIRLKEVLTIYFLSLGVFIPVSGWAADRFGEKNSMLFAIVLFTGSSLACGLSINLPLLIIFRLLQGAGGAFLMPVGRQIIVRVFPGKVERIKAMTSINVMTLLGLLMGPLIGGALTTYANWRWIFFINIPIGLLAYVLTYRYMPFIREKLHSQFDFAGFLFIGISLGSMLCLLDVLMDTTISGYLKFFLLMLSVGGIIAYIPHARRSSAPLISLNLFNKGDFGPAAVSSFLSRLTTATHPFLIPLLLQAGYGFSAIRSGFYTVPVIFSTMICMFCLSKLIKRFENKRLLITATILIMIIFCSFYFQAVELMPALLIVQQLLMGFLLPVQTSLMNTQAYENLPEPYVSQGVSVYSGIIQVSGSFAIALAALVMIATIGPNDLQHHVPLAAFKVVFIVQSLYSLIALWFFVKIPENKFS